MAEQGCETDSDRGGPDEENGSLGLTEPTGSLFDLVEFLARNLALNPDAVSVSQGAKDDVTTFELRLHKDDLGRVIGKQGRTAKSLRTILNAAASRIQQRASLEIIEE